MEFCLFCYFMFLLRPNIIQCIEVDTNGHKHLDFYFMYNLSLFIHYIHTNGGGGCGGGAWVMGGWDV